jgi:ABC-type dipeptide/oligopeptide/nickel transport system permease component
MKFRPALRFLFSVWLLVTLNFILIRLLPGTPLDRLESLNPLVIRKLNEEFNLQGGTVSQYFKYVGNILTGDLGPSVSYPGSSVGYVIQEHLSVTMELNLLALFFVFVISLVFVWGLLRHPDGKTAAVFYFLSLALISAPSILLAPLLILIFSVKLGWIPAAFLKSHWHYILPALILALRPAVYLSRSLTAIMEEEFQKDYVRTAKAKGIAPNKIIFKHVMKNSIVPVLNLLGPVSVGLLSGSAFVEILFAIQGLGHLFVVSLQERDYFLSSGLVLIFGTVLLFLSHFFEAVARRVDRRLEGVT